MSWWEYVTRTSGTASPREMQARTGVDSPNFSRWKSGHVPKPDLVAQFARTYGRPVVEAFVAAGFLTAEEAKVRPNAAPDFTQLSNDELLALVAARMREEGGSGGDTAPTNDGPAAGPAPVTPIPRAARRGKRQRTDEPGDG